MPLEGRLRFFLFIFVLVMFTCVCGREYAKSNGLTRHQSLCHPYKAHHAELSENRRARRAAQGDRKAKRQKVDNPSQVLLFLFAFGLR